MILASHQPNFFPYMGYFYKIAKSDLFIFSDDVQFSNSKTGDMHNYNYIKGPQGKQKITLPITYTHGDLVKDARIFNDKKQIQDIMTAIQQYYSKAPFFEEVYSDIKSILDIFLDHDYADARLADFNSFAIRRICKKFGITTSIKWSPGFTSKKDARLIEMCERYGADTYLSGSGAASYHVPADFEENGIKLVYTDYEPPVYPQRYGDFIPNLSVLDWIFNMGYTLPEGWL